MADHTDHEDSMDLSPETWLTLRVNYRKAGYDFTFPDDATIAALFDEIQETLQVPIENQKIIAPKCPLLKAPFKDPHMPLQELKGKTLTLMGSSTADVQAIQDMSHRVAERNKARRAQMAHKHKARSQRRNPEDSQYTFLQVRPLQGLPHPEKSQSLLMRLKEDPGIRAAMRKHKFSVGLLTEMEPLAHTQTTHEGTSRILGLNRNQGEVIELRLRTDAHDGYRDYKTIRKTLCHELAHNVHGPHDQKFWDLCHQIEREVQAADWKSGGQTIGESSRHSVFGAEEEDENYEDHGGWTGGEFVLGGASDPTAGLSRREILAQAALERQKKQAEAERKVLESADKWRRSPPPGDETK